MKNILNLVEKTKSQIKILLINEDNHTNKIVEKSILESSSTSAKIE